MLTRWITSLTLAVSLNAQPIFPKETPPPERIAVPEEGISLPMLDIGGRPVVEVRLNGKGLYRFILDTGATLSVIDSGLTEELKLAAGGSGTVRIDRVEIGGVSLVLLGHKTNILL